MALNSQHKRVSKNRVSITFDVETNGAVQTKELPFVVGVLGDFSAHREDKPALADREYINIDKNNFDQVMTRIAPRLSYAVNNTLKNDDSRFNVDLNFTSIKDFSPDSIIEQVEPLKKLVAIRVKLKTLLSKVDRSRELDGLLNNLLQDNEAIALLSEELNLKTKKQTETESSDE
ncbi:type VI secretion system contractile sheath small subunit [Thalassomonas sp. RHCl1]|uniref:type VI secretion system contractile sheath small subunit n=1 Tax=Thalassomonas sp. RHCl1 TaxID=2995320 RepID=UPI00248B7393|nr:type VI secretion system contractile sheath small subunit [Thalassomonas sp. RHCl1]